MSIQFNEFIGDLYQASPERLKVLSQEERAFSLRCLASIADAAASFVSRQADRVREKLHKQPTQKGAARRFFAPVVSLAKGALNLLRLRCSSAKLSAALDAHRQEFLDRTTGTDVMRFCVGNPDTATIFFIGEHHADPDNDDFFVKQVSRIKEERNLEDADICCLFESEPSLEPFAHSLRRGFGWDDMEAYDESVEWLRKSQAREITSQKFTSELDRCTAKRNESLIRTVKAMQTAGKKVIVVQAGLEHFVSKTDYILKHFDPAQCCLMAHKSVATEEESMHYADRILESAAVD
jgi:hypothetical protein